MSVRELQGERVPVSVKSARVPRLFVCDGDLGGPRFHPRRRVQTALRGADIEYEKVVVGHGSPFPFLRKSNARGTLYDDRNAEAANAETA